MPEIASRLLLPPSSFSCGRVAELPSEDWLAAAEWRLEGQRVAKRRVAKRRVEVVLLPAELVSRAALTF